MKLAIMQPYFFPYLGYWQLITAVDTFVVLDDVNFIKRGWINRNNILVNNQAHLFSIPLDKPSQNKLIMETKLKFPYEQREKWLKMIEMSYKKAPYYRYVYPLLEQIIIFDDSDLTAFIINSFYMVLRYLGIERKIICSSQIEKDNTLRAQNRIIAICKKMQTDMYINPIGGQLLYREDDFAKENIDLRFIKTAIKPYEQFGGEFVGGLSFIDILMFNDIIKINNMLKDYALIKGEM